MSLSSKLLPKETTMSIELFNRLLELAKAFTVEDGKSKKPKKEMLAQQSFPPSGPALFMEGPKVRQPKSCVDSKGEVFAGVSREERVWVQPEEVPNRPSKCSLRVRDCDPPRITTQTLS